MDKILNFDTQASYDAVKDSLEYPTVSYITDNDLVYFLSKVELYEWVDLGLPSGLKWAAWNVGATKPEEYGLYFAWGETQGYTAEDVENDEKEFIVEDYELCNGSETTLTKYNNNSSNGTVDNKLKLEQEDDAAYQSDNTCRMPTIGECQELINNTTSAWTTDYNGSGVSGVILTSTKEGYTDKSIFLPAAGQFSYGSLSVFGSLGVYWSSSLGENNSRLACNLGFGPSFVSTSSGDSRFSGRSVRAVLPKS